MSHKTVRLHPVDVAFVASSVQLHNIFVTSLPKLRTDGITDPTDGLLNQFDHSYGVVVAEYNARTAAAGAGPDDVHGWKTEVWRYECAGTNPRRSNCFMSVHSFAIMFDGCWLVEFTGQKMNGYNLERLLKILQLT